MSENKSVDSINSYYVECEMDYGASGGHNFALRMRFDHSTYMKDITRYNWHVKRRDDPYTKMPLNDYGVQYLTDVHKITGPDDCAKFLTYMYVRYKETYIADGEGKLYEVLKGLTDEQLETIKNTVARRNKKDEFHGSTHQYICDLWVQFENIESKCCAAVDNEIEFRAGLKTEEEYTEDASTITDELAEAEQRLQQLKLLGGYYNSITLDRGPDRTFIDVIGAVVNNNDYYKPTDLDTNTSNKIEEKASIILTTVTNIGMVISILILAILGIKYMLGSVEEKAEYKKDMIPYLVGAGLAFGITAIVKILMVIGYKLNSF